MTDLMHEPPQLADRLHGRLAGPVAFLASCLGTVCLLNSVLVGSSVEELTAVDDRAVGWAGVGIVAGVVLGVGAMLTIRRFGAGPALSLGAAGSVFGLALGHQLVRSEQAVFGPAVLGASAGCLLAGAAGMAFELAPRDRRVVVAAWVAPIVAAWPVLAALALHADREAAPSLSLHPPVLLLASVTALIVVWSALAMLLDPHRADAAADPPWESAWLALLSVGLGGGLLVMALGFERTMTGGWLRPLILLGVAAVGGVLCALPLLVPSVPAELTSPVRVGLICVLMPVVAVTAVVPLLLTVAAGDDRDIEWWAPAVLSVAALAGAALGGWRPRLAPLAFVLLAAGCAASWPMPNASVLTTLSGGLLCLAAGAAFGAGARFGSRSPVGWRFTVCEVVVVLLLAATTSLALGWALGGDVPASVSSARAAGRVLLGIFFALSVLAAAAVAVLMARVPRQVPDRTTAADSSDKATRAGADVYR